MGRLFANMKPVIGVVTGNQRGGFIERTWEALTFSAKEHDCHLLLLPGEINVYAGAPPDLFDISYAFVSSVVLDGLVVLSANINHESRWLHMFTREGMAGLGIPVVAVGRVLEGIPSVVMDNATGIKEAMHHLIATHGYRRVAFIRGLTGHTHAEARFEAYKESLKEHGIAYRSDRVYEGDFSYQCGVRAAKRMLADGLEYLDAVFACNDDTALGWLHGMHEEGVEVPADMRLVGFDDSCEGQAGVSHVSTVRQPIHEMAAWAMKQVLGENEANPVEVKVMPSHYVRRSSCGCPAYASLQQERPITLPDNGRGSLMERLQQSWPLLYQGLSDRMKRIKQSSGKGPLLTDLINEIPERLERLRPDGPYLSFLCLEMTRLVESEDDPSFWDGLLEALRQLIDVMVSDNAGAKTDYLLLQLRVSISDSRMSKRRMKRMGTNLTRSLRSDDILALTSCDNQAALFKAIPGALSAIGIRRYALMLFHDSTEQNRWGQFLNQELPEFSRMVYAQGLGNQIGKCIDQRFPTKDLLPEGVSFEGEQLNLILEPLFFGETLFGYQITEIRMLGEGLYESIRPQMATALHVISLISQLKEALETVNRTRDQLVQSEKMAALGTLVSGFAHELNTPVGISITAASYLRHLLDETGKTFCEAPSQRSEKMEQLLKKSMEGVDILQTNLMRASELVTGFKRVAADQASEEKRSFLLREYLEQVLASLRPKLKHAAVDVDIQCPPDLLMDSYPGALFQVMSNLLLNTLMHAHPDGSPGQVIVKVDSDGPEVLIVYEDDGVGIPEAMRVQVFEPFFTTARSKGGTGIGMNVVFNSVTRVLEGHISCESSASLGGVCFHLRMPRVL